MSEVRAVEELEDEVVFEAPCVGVGLELSGTRCSGVKDVGHEPLFEGTVGARKPEEGVDLLDVVDDRRVKVVAPLLPDR